jgi:hypothetical protein
MADTLDRRELGSSRLEKSDILLLLGMLATAAALPLILVFARGEDVTMLGIVWRWIVGLAIWLYLIVPAV